MSQPDGQQAAVKPEAAAPGSRILREVLALDAPVLLLASMAFVTQLGVAIMLPLIPLYALSLGAVPRQLGLLTSAFAITTAIGQFGAGLLSDRLGARVFLRTGIAIYAGANVLIATAANAVMLIAYRALAGLGAGANLLAERVYLAQVADPKRMAFVNGVLSAAASAGQVAGPAFGGIVAALADLRAPFLIVGVTSGLTFVASLFLPRPARPAAPHEGAGPIAELATAWRSVVVLILAQLFLLAGYGAFITTYAPLATANLGWSTPEVGIVFSFFGAGSIALGPWLSHLADRVGRRRVAVLSVVPVALFGFSLVVALPRLMLYGVTFVAGGGLTAFTAAWYALLGSASPGVRRGRTFGIANAVSQLGVVIGATLASEIWQSVGLSAAMSSAGVAILLAGAALLMLPREVKLEA